MQKHILVVSALVFGLSAACGVQAGEYMSGDEIKAMITDQTVYGEHPKNGKKRNKYFKADGTFVWQGDGKTLPGKWWINSADMLCIKRQEGKKKCRYIQRTDGGYKKYKPVGNAMAGHKHAWTVTRLVPGNPEGL